MERLKHKIWSPGYSSEWRSEDGVAYSAYNKFDIPETPFRMIFLSFLSFLLFLFFLFLFLFLFLFSFPFSSGATQWHIQLIHSTFSEISRSIHDDYISQNTYSWMTLRGNNSWRLLTFLVIPRSYQWMFCIVASSSRGSSSERWGINGYLTNVSNT